jgi:hypothetical protein
MIHREPKWYETTMFYVCYLMAIAAGLYAMAFVIAVCISAMKGG